MKKKESKFNKKFVTISLAIIVLIFSTMFLVSQFTPKKLGTRERIDKSIDNGLFYLKDSFQEPYFYPEVLNWFYDNNPPEVWQYGKIDISTNFIYIKTQFKDYSKIKPVVDKAENYLKEVAKRMENSTIDTTYLAYGNPVENYRQGDYALDTTCIVAGLFNDPLIAKNLYNFLDSNNDWAYVDLHNPYIGWRAIADESWCISLLAGNHYPTELMKMLWETKLNESFDYMNDPKIFDSRKYGGIMHTLLMYKVFEKEGYLDSKNELYLGSDYKTEINAIYKKEVELVDSLEVNSDASNLANTIYILALYEYGKEDNYSKLEGMANKLMNMQKTDGSWAVLDIKKNKEVIPGFTTLRAVVSLNLLRIKIDELS